MNSGPYGGGWIVALLSDRNGLRTELQDRSPSTTTKRWWVDKAWTAASNLSRSGGQHERMNR